MCNPKGKPCLSGLILNQTIGIAQALFNVLLDEDQEFTNL
jgi:hypothetical protein